MQLKRYIELNTERMTFAQAVSRVEDYGDRDWAWPAEIEVLALHASFCGNIIQYPYSILLVADDGSSTWLMRIHPHTDEWAAIEGNNHETIVEIAFDGMIKTIDAMCSTAFDSAYLSACSLLLSDMEQFSEPDEDGVRLDALTVLHKVLGSVVVEPVKNNSNPALLDEIENLAADAWEGRSDTE